MKFVHKQIYYIVFLGLLLRLSFYFFGAEIYFGNKNFYIGGDSLDYLNPFINLLKTGTFTVNPDHPEGVFGREPGYSFITGIFYLLGGSNIQVGFKLLVWFQILFDSFLVFIVYKTSQNIFNKTALSLLTAFIYASYPFIILWTSIVYAEWAGVACILLTLYFISSKKSDKKYLIYAGIFAALGALIRPSLVLIPAAFSISLFFYFYESKKIKSAFVCFMLFHLGFAAIYVWWPLRNLVNHHELELFKRVEGITRAISTDRLSFAFFMWAVKTDWEPQISQLLAGEEVEMPEWVWKISKDDSIKIKQALFLSYQCGDGFRQQRKLPPLPKDQDCTTEVALLWKELRKTVVDKAPIQFYFLVPLSNLKKAIFKNSLIKSFNRPEKNNKINAFLFMLFLYRTMLIIFGCLGIIKLLLTHWHANFHTKNTLLFISLFFLALYTWLCFIYRDMDIRYLLPADVLLLFPASYFIFYLSECVLQKFKAPFLLNKF